MGVQKRPKKYDIIKEPPLRDSTKQNVIMDKTDEDAYRPINFSSLFDIYSEGPGTLASMVCQNRTLDFYVLQGGKKGKKGS